MGRKLLYGLLALLLFSLYFLTEDVRTVHHGWHNNDSLKAAYRLLENRGIDSERIYGSARLFPLPPTDTLLVMDSNRGKLSESHRQALHDWVRSGGRLVLEARSLYYNDDEPDEENDQGSEDASEEPVDDDLVNYALQDYDESDLYDNDPLMYSFGISAWYVPREEAWHAATSYLNPTQWQIEQSSRELTTCLAPTAEEREGCERELCGDHSRTPTYSSGFIGDELRQAAFIPEEKLMHIDQFGRDNDEYYDATTPNTDTELNLSLDNEYGAQLLHLYYGEGDIIAVTNLDIWYNQHLAWLDHAWLLREISQGYQHVWWVHSVDMPPLGAWLWQRAWPLIISLLVLLVLFLWMKMPRVGVMLPQWRHGARDFLHHLHASANFLWRHRQIDALLSPLREQVRRQLRQRRGEEDIDQLCLAAAALGLDGEAIRYAMLSTPPDDQALTDMIATLQQLRSRI